MKKTLDMFKIIFTKNGVDVDELVVYDHNQPSAFKYGVHLCRGTNLRVRVIPLHKV